MNQHVRNTRHRLAAAVAVALAVTAGAAVAPAGAAMPMTGAAVETTVNGPADADVVPFPKDAMVVAAGPKGFLSYQSGSTVTWRWTRYLDGATTVLPSGGRYVYAPESDIVPEIVGNGRFTMHDMITGTALELDISPLGDGYDVVGYAGADILAKKADATGGHELHVIGERAGALVDDTVTGLPTDAVIADVTVDGPATAVVRYSSTVDGVRRSRAAVVDIASHAVVEEYALPAGGRGAIDLSATHIAWVEQTAASTVTVAVTPRKTDRTVRHDLGTMDSPAHIQLVGEWLTYRQSGNWDSDPYIYAHPLKARSLTTGETVTLLDNTVTDAPGPDGSQMVRGGTIAHGEGLYRIDAGGGATRPVVTFVASTGQPTALVLVSHTVPATIDFDRTTAPVSLSWNFGRTRTRVYVELIHTASKKQAALQAFTSEAAAGSYIAEWDGLFDDSVPAYNGDYVWRIRAEPTNGVGPVLVRSGTFKVVRKATSHDFDDNGSSDLLLRNGKGEVFVHTGYPDGWGPLWKQKDPVRIGTGWNTYDQLVAPGNVAGSSYADIIARDKTGVLWLHQGAGRTLASRVRVGGGWQIYSRITGGSDLNGDRRPDLLATDKAGVLWLYKGTGSAASPFASRTRIGGGWGVYNEITATGDLGGNPTGDLVARDGNDTLWLYLGKGDGTFTPRTRIGSNWNPFLPVRVGDVDRDGRADLVGYSSSGGVYFAKGTGNWRAPFKDLELMSYVWNLQHPNTVF
ncbi:FG-GAP repeat domain-containing protein [Streptomyces sp. NPDC052494]|uniref:FG-GAP repeat domain-containing protein n=1 Tax=Streptomyces sp. NPDC052494 TaxID=3365692 RepID=UPI0037D81459